MSSMKEIDLLADKIGDVLGINPNLISLSQVPGGLWFADVSNIESEHLDSPIKAMKNLLEKNKSRDLWKSCLGLLKENYQ